MPEIADWDSFYLIVGGAAGALIGLQFVVMTLIAERPPRDMERLGAAFSTPTIVHFSVVLVLAALLRVPWRDSGPVAVLGGLAALGGMAYSIVVRTRMKAQAAYRPEIVDWIFHVAVPFIAYALLGGSAVALCGHERAALFGVAAAALALLLVGIHNTWDAVLYHVARRRGPPPDDRRG